MSPLQTLATEHTEHAERVKFMSKRVIFCHSAHLMKIFTTQFLTKYKITFGCCDLCGLYGEKITFSSEVIFELLVAAAQFIILIAKNWPQEAVFWLRQPDGKLGLKSDRDGPYLLLRGLSAALQT